MRVLAPVVIVLAAFLATVWLDEKPPEADVVYVNRNEVFTLDPQRMTWLQDFRLAYCLYEGLARWKTAQRRIVASGADLVLCGHDHQEQVDALDGVVVACAGTLSTRSRGGRPPVFFRIVIEDDAIRVEHYRWDAGGGVFRRSDQHQFARRRPVSRARAAS